VSSDAIFLKVLQLFKSMCTDCVLQNTQTCQPSAVMTAADASATEVMISPRKPVEINVDFLVFHNRIVM